MRVALVVSCICAAEPAWAFGKAENDQASIEAVGSVLALGSFMHFPPTQPAIVTDDGLGALVTRLLLNGHLPWQIDYEGNFFLDLQSGPTSLSSGTFSTASSFVTPYRTRYLQWNFWQQGAVSGQLAVDRLRFHKSFGDFDVDIGRFPVNHSVTTLITPNDFFVPFSATTLVRQFKPGVDAVRVRWGIASLVNVEALSVLGSLSDGQVSWAQTAVTLRVDTTLAGFQYAVTGGKLAERWMVGGTVQGDIHGVVLRAEGHAGFPDRNGDGKLDGPVFGRGAAHIEYSWSWQNAMLGAEYAFFTDGAAAPSDYIARSLRFFPNDLPYLGRHYAALTAGIDIVAVLKTSVTGLVNAQDGSGITTLSLIYNVANEVDLVGGCLVGWGARPVIATNGSLILNSEFGLTPIAAFTSVQVAF